MSLVIYSVAYLSQSSLQIKICTGCFKKTPFLISFNFRSTKSFDTSKKVKNKILDMKNEQINQSNIFLHAVRNYDDKITKINTLRCPRKGVFFSRHLVHLTSISSKYACNLVHTFSPVMFFLILFI